MTAEQILTEIHRIGCTYEVFLALSKVKSQIANALTVVGNPDKSVVPHVKGESEMSMLNDTQRKILVSKLNELISDCIGYGGDFGGPYFNENYYKSVIDQMRDIRDWCLSDHIIVLDGEVPMFAKEVKE